MNFNSVIVTVIQRIPCFNFGIKALIILLNGLFIIAVLVNFTSCCSYSFTGASVPPHLKTISIPVADDRSGAGVAGLRELFTSMLTQKFIDDNTLRVSDRVNANASLDCVISSYSDAPAVVTGGNNVTTRRITIGIQVIYKDLVKRKNIFEQTFSNYGDYSGNGGLNEKNAAINVAMDKITEDILLAAVSGW
ncbi:MAG: hypothetical protein P4L35_14695 [Ignavibacteriaceae bacterium]|nr:hypothetical protein [Ignavibacteriaceae bacterium]